VRSLLADPAKEFLPRAVTRHPDSDKAKALAALGSHVVAGDADDPASLEQAFAGAHGVYCVTNFWEHMSAEREGAQARAMARAAGRARVKHVVWSTLEDARKTVPLDDARLPTLQGKYKVPHFDMKGEMDAVFAHEAPTSFLLAAFYWENFIYFGAGPRKGEDGKLTLALPLGGAKLPGIAAEDIGRCAHGIFRRGPGAVGQRFGVCGEILSGPDMARKLGRALGQEVGFFDVPFDAYRKLGFPGADDMGNMFQYQALLGDAFYAARDPRLAKELDPLLADFDTWLAHNASRIPLG
jgi:uncharacterized protein YbjT (DUF2867 family)